MSTSDRQHDLVVWGATGVAGCLPTAYLLDQYTPESLSLASGIGMPLAERLREVGVTATAEER